MKEFLKSIAILFLSLLIKTGIIILYTFIFNNYMLPIINESLVTNIDKINPCIVLICYFIYVFIVNTFLDNKKVKKVKFQEALLKIISIGINAILNVIFFIILLNFVKYFYY